MVQKNLHFWNSRSLQPAVNAVCLCVFKYVCDMNQRRKDIKTRLKKDINWKSWKIISILRSSYNTLFFHVRVNTYGLDVNMSC